MGTCLFILLLVKQANGVLTSAAARVLFFFPLAVMMAVIVVPWKLNVKSISVVPDMLWTNNKKKAISHHL